MYLKLNSYPSGWWPEDEFHLAGDPDSGPLLGNQRPGYVQPRVCASGHIKDPVPLIEKSSASCPGGRFPPSFIPRVIIITGLNKL